MVNHPNRGQRSLRDNRNDDQLAALLAHKADIDAMLARLTAWSNEHFDVSPDDVTWTTVATIGEVARKLRSATDFAFGEGENAL